MDRTMKPSTYRRVISPSREEVIAANNKIYDLQLAGTKIFREVLNMIEPILQESRSLEPTDHHWHHETFRLASHRDNIIRIAESYLQRVRQVEDGLEEIHRLQHPRNSMFCWGAIPGTATHRKTTAAWKRVKRNLDLVLNGICRMHAYYQETLEELNEHCNEFVTRLELVPIEQVVEADTCTICTEPFLVPSDEEPGRFNLREMVVRLPCAGGHIFDLECIAHWLEANGSCPFDREELVVFPDEELHRHAAAMENLIFDYESEPEEDDPSSPEDDVDIPGAAGDE